MLKRPLLLFVLLSAVLLAVVMAQRELRQVADTTKFDADPLLSEPQTPSLEGTPSEAASTPDRDSQAKAAPPLGEIPQKDPVIEAPKNLSLKDIRSILQQTKVVFQAIDQMRQELEKSPHGVASTLVAAASKLSEVIELEKAYPLHKNEFTSFYQNCAQDEATLTVMRAQCAQEYLRLAALPAEAEQSFVESLAQPVKNLYKASR